MARAGSPPPIEGADRALAAFAYEGAARSLVLGLKVGRQRSRARPLATGLAETVWREGLLADVLTWVPGRAWDVVDRGFDHAHLLAAGLSRKTGLRAVRLLRRTDARPDQHSLSRDARLANSAGAFSASGCEGLRVAVVDDLVTTGATAGACCSALRAAGAASVEVVAACLA